MARGSTLQTLLTKLNNEIGQVDSPSYSVGAKSANINLLQRVQRQLWQNHDWRFLRIKKDIQLQAGSRYYDFPAEIDTTRVIEVKTKYSSSWVPVKFGINEDEAYAVFDSDLDQRNDPVQRWDYHYDTTNDAEQLEVWPLPASNYDSTTLNAALRVIGIKSLSTLVDDSDTADLDDDLIVMFAAAEILARDRVDDAAKKLDDAQKLYDKLTENISGHSTFQLGAGVDEDSEDKRLHLRAVYGDYTGA